MLSALLVGAAVNGCATTSDEQLLRRAASDWHCPEEELTVTRIDETTRLVWGCEQDAKYFYVCAHPHNPFNSGCSWVKDRTPRASED